jgi:hypothetical protein
VLNQPDAVLPEGADVAVSMELTAWVSNAGRQPTRDELDLAEAIVSQIPGFEGFHFTVLSLYGVDYEDGGKHTVILK